MRLQVPTAFLLITCIKNLKNMQKEIWKDVPVCDNIIQASNLGRIRTIKRMIIRSCGRKYTINAGIRALFINKGYYRFTIRYNSISNNYLAHRLVAMAFIPNPLMNPEVNHKDGNKLNNNIENLEWVTKSENIIHSFKILGRIPPNLNNKGGFNCLSKKVLQYSIDGVFIKEYHGIRDASRITNIPHSNISNVCSNKKLSAGGYKWMFKN